MKKTENNMTDHIDTSPELVEWLLDGVTPGPWELGGCSGRMIKDPDGRGDGFLADFDLKANAAFACAARQLVPALSAERDRLTAENAAMRADIAVLTDALRYYDSDEAWSQGQVEGPNGDYGKKARAALAASQPRKTDTNGG
jgi:hypothetical protein